MAKQKIDEEALSSQAPPFSIVDFIGRRTIEAKAMPYWDHQGFEDSFPSKTDLVYHAFLSQRVQIKICSKKERKIRNLHALMSAPITCTLSFTNVLKIRPDLWESVANMLQDMGLWNEKLRMDKVLKTKNFVSRHSTKAPI